MNSPSNGDPDHGIRDVRMKGFSRRATVDEAISWIDQMTLPDVREELVALDHLAGRVLARDIISQVNVPGFDRAMMDGYAVRANDTAGASTYNPLPLEIVGEILPGQPFDGELQPGQAVRIMTGAPMPTGADAVLPVEKTESDNHRVLVMDSLPEQKHIGASGEDIRVGECVLAAGRRIRPQDIGVLSSIGLAQLPVFARPRTRIVITGNELLPSGTRPAGYRIADANGPMLAALVERDGGNVVNRELIPDTPEAILAAMQDEVDVVLVSGGSSVGIEDYAPQLLAQHGELAFHGIAMRPSSPSGMGTMGNRTVFLLPGNPVSCLCSYDFFAGRALRRLAGLPLAWPYRQQRLRLKRKIVSQVGRVDYARVRVADSQAEPIAVAGASRLSSTTRADGFVIIPTDSEGYPPQTEVDVYLYDNT